MATRIYPVILSDGAGSRLWPMSRVLLPKQFLPLLSDRTMLQETVLRLSGFGGCAAAVIVSNSEHRFVVADASAIQGELGWQPRRDDIRLICESALRWEEQLNAMRANKASRHSPSRV